MVEVLQDAYKAQADRLTALETVVGTEENPVTPAPAEAQVDQDLLEKLRDFDIEDAAGALARNGFKKLRTFQRMEDRLLYAGGVGGVRG